MSRRMVYRLMNLHGLICPHNFEADITGVGKIASKVFGFQVISHIGS